MKSFGVLAADALWHLYCKSHNSILGGNKKRVLTMGAGLTSHQHMKLEDSRVVEEGRDELQGESRSRQRDQGDAVRAVKGAASFPSH